MTSQELLTISRQAISHMNQHEFGEAARCWERVLEAQPDWEHGGGAYDLATCYEELGRMEDAARMYREAVGAEPENPTFLGGYGSFLYLHGTAGDAFSVYATLLCQARARKDVAEESVLTRVLLDLGARLGLSELQVRQRLA